MKMRHFLSAVLAVSVTAVVGDSNAIAFNTFHHPHHHSYMNRGFSLNERGKTKYMRPCYFTNWAQYRPGKGKYVPEDYEPGLCTHILFAFGWMNEDFTVKAFDPADLKTSWAEGMYDRVNALKLKDPELQTLLSIGGWTFGTRLFKAMAKTAEGRKTFIDSSMVFVRQHGFDGLDIDWEYPAGDDDKAAYSRLISECRAAFEAEAARTNRPRLLLSAAVSAGEATINNAYHIPSLAEAFDFILLMSYDFHGAWESGTGMNSPLFPREEEIFWQKVWNVDWAANHWYKSGMPKEKIIIGIPTYGRGWTLKDAAKHGLGAETSGPAKKTKYTREAGVASYYEFCDMFDKGAKRYYDEETQVPYLVHGDQWFSYDDEDSIRNKMGWLKSKGYGGAFVWTLDFDDFKGVCKGGKRYPLISIIRDELAGSSPLSHTTTAATTEAVTTMPTTPASTTTSMGTSTTTTMTTTEEMTTTMGPEICEELGLLDGFQEFPKRVGFEAVDSMLYCGKFLLCLEGRSYRMACPAALEYDDKLGYCTMKPDSPCHMPTTTSTMTTTETPTSTLAPNTTTLPLTTAAPTRAPSGTYKCPGTGFFASKYCCNKFYRCVEFGDGQLRAYPFTCPPPLHFDESMLVCVHPTASKCDESTTPGGQKCD